MTLEEKKAAWELCKRDAPQMAQFVLDMKATFGPISVSHIKIGDFEAGEPPSAVFPFTFDYHHKESMKQWESTIEDPAFQKARQARNQRAAARRPARGKR